MSRQHVLSAAPDRAANDDNAGIFRVSRTALPALRQAAQELKQAFFCVNLEKARNVPGFVRAFGRYLDFPESFSGNLDALRDGLSDLSWHPASGYVIALDGYETLRAIPTSFAMLNEVLASAVAAWRSRNVPFRIVYLYDAAVAPAPQSTAPGTP